MKSTIHHPICVKGLFLVLVLAFVFFSCDKKETDEVDITDTEDVTPPTPDPMTWSVKPTGISKTSVSMTATTATDPGGVEYYFEAISAGGHSSEWQTEPVYVDQGLIEGNTYAYRVKARDESGNETAFSEEASAKTEADVTPPNPDPMTWAVQPVSIGATSISMTSTTATDPGGVEYYFEALSAGGHSSGWQTAPVYVDKDLSEGNTYSYKVKARDASGNETAYSVEASAKTSSSMRNPIITKDMLPLRDGENINGPSLIRVPDWIPVDKRADPKAVYYLYFGHHAGGYIRMAWAENVMGPYTFYSNDRKGVLNKEGLNNNMVNTQSLEHMASPEVLVDNDKKRIIMYYHANLNWKGVNLNQTTGVAVSEDGLNFAEGCVDMPICNTYARIFEYKNEMYAITNIGGLWKAHSAEYPWTADFDGDGTIDIAMRVEINGEMREGDLDNDGDIDEEDLDVYIVENGGLWQLLSIKRDVWDDKINPFEHLSGNIRHSGLKLRGDILDIFFSRYPSTPEHIEYISVDLSANVDTLWAGSEPVSILKPEYSWEGADLPLEESKMGAAIGVRQLRDPYIFTDIDGTEYLLYTGRGEEAIGIVLLSDVMP